MASTFQIPANNASNTLSASIVGGDLACTLVSSALFPVTYPFPITIDSEIIKVTNNNTGTGVLTIVRAQEGTSAASHSSGAVVSLKVTAKFVSDLNTAVNALEGGIAGNLDDTAGGTDALTTKAPTSNALYDGLLTKIPNSVLTERGSVIFRNATIPAELLHGTTGQVLTTKGDGADPLWLNNDIYSFPVVLAATTIGTAYTVVSAWDFASSATGNIEARIFGLGALTCKYRFLGTVKKGAGDGVLDDTITMRFLFAAPDPDEYGGEVAGTLPQTYYANCSAGFATAWVTSLGNPANANQIRIQAKMATNNNVFTMITLAVQFQAV